jgi:hypothetical protein
MLFLMPFQFVPGKFDLDARSLAGGSGLAIFDGVQAIGQFLPCDRRFDVFPHSAGASLQQAVSFGARHRSHNPITPVRISWTGFSAMPFSPKYPARPEARFHELSIP